MQFRGNWPLNSWKDSGYWPLNQFVCCLLLIDCIVANSGEIGPLIHCIVAKSGDIGPLIHLFAVYWFNLQGTWAPYTLAVNSFTGCECLLTYCALYWYYMVGLCTCELNTQCTVHSFTVVIDLEQWLWLFYLTCIGDVCALENQPSAQINPLMARHLICCNLCIVGAALR